MQNFHWILRAEEFEDGADVRGRLLGGAIRRVRKDRHWLIVGTRNERRCASSSMDRIDVK